MTTESDSLRSNIADLFGKWNQDKGLVTGKSIEILKLQALYIISEQLRMANIISISRNRSDRNRGNARKAFAEINKYIANECSSSDMQRSVAGVEDQRDEVAMANVDTGDVVHEDAAVNTLAESQET